MAETWGNGTPPNPIQYNEDWVSNPGNHNVLKVNTDTGDQGAGDNKVAVHAINKSTAVNARALKAEGMAEVIGVPVEPEDDPTIGLKAVNDKQPQRLPGAARSRARGIEGAA